MRARAEKVRRPVSHKVVRINVDPREQEGNLNGLLPQPHHTPPSSHRAYATSRGATLTVKHQVYVYAVLLGPVAYRNVIYLTIQHRAGGRAPAVLGEGDGPRNIPREPEMAKREIQPIL